MIAKADPARNDVAAMYDAPVISGVCGGRILIVYDTPANLDVLTQLLEPQGYRILVASNGEQAVSLARRAQPNLVLLDIVMPDLDGYHTCRRLKADPATESIPVIFISARDKAVSLVEGFSVGAVDYIAKPFDRAEVLARVQTHLRISGLTQELMQRNDELRQRSEELTRINGELNEEVKRREQAEDALHVADSQLSLLGDRETERWGIAAFIGKSRTMGRILNDVRRLQNFGSVNVLITGESGTGKELVARALHFGSVRSQGPFIPVNCVSIPSELADSAFFGHMRGAFTGATIDRRGYFELAHGGTLFLDEIGDMPPGLQAKLLRVLEDGCVTPVGGSKEKRVNVRIVAATNADPQERIEAGAFRSDLYFRLAQYTVELPPLRDRLEDVPLLAAHFLTLFATEMGQKLPPMSTEATEALMRYAFPGNVRELKNISERAMIDSGGGEIRLCHLRLGTGRGGAPAKGGAAKSGTSGKGGGSAGSRHADDELAQSLPLNLEEAEDLLVRRALQETHGNIAEAARRLGINRTRIYRRLGGADKTSDASS